MTVLSITTDFGLASGFVGIMKGVIYGIAPQVKIVDISHLVPAQNVLQGAYVMWRAVPYFPPGSIHVGVVDPGVGTGRRPLGMRLGDQFFIAPDNGLLTLLIQDAERKGEIVEFLHLDNRAYWLPQVSNTFHGRDIFAPAAAHLAAGVPFRELGTPVTDLVRLELPHPEKTDTGWLAHVITIDAFGNLGTDLLAEALALSPQGEGRRRALLRIRGHEIEGILDSYGQREAGALVAVVNSDSFIEIAVVNGSAARILGAQSGDEVEVFLPD